ncbi:rcc01693 family protein [Ciceribacter thiooxidans]|uniref:Rcc01693 family protein n=2 Tax=Ciceribacter thiooxidans TaxID=1969821 RepID=A0ABV7I9G6_9HYPH
MRAAGEGTERAATVAFPWRAAMHAGLGLLRLDPDDFWRLSPREFAAMTGAFAPAAPRLARAGLETLMQAFPDG